ncbi:MAG: hypothetical protein ACM3L6_01940 [Deltaproteobacteria bacterium]
MKRFSMALIVGTVFLIGSVGVSEAFWGKKEKTQTQKAAETQVKEAQPAAAPAVEAKEAPAQEQAAVPQEEKKVEAAPAPPPVSEKDLEKKRVMKDKARQAIDGNQWEVSVIAMSGKGEKTPDALIFKDNKFSSKEYAQKGYAPSNYTISLTDDGRAVVETMQSEEKQGICFWRVEFDDKFAGLTGVLSRQLSENKTEDYSFVSTGKTPIPKE